MNLAVLQNIKVILMSNQVSYRGDQLPVVIEALHAIDKEIEAQAKPSKPVGKPVPLEEK